MNTKNIKPWQDENRIQFVVDENGFGRKEAKAGIMATVIEENHRRGSLLTFDFHCPKCGEKASVHTGSLVWDLAFQHVNHGFTVNYYR